MVAMGKARATIHDVARKAGVSLATVSKVVNDDPAISDATVARVREAIRTLGYRGARPGARRRLANDVIGVVVPDVVNPYFALLLEGVLGAARTHSFGCLVIESRQGRGTDQEAIELLRERGARGLIYVPSNPDVDQLQRLLGEGVPLVFLDRILDGIRAPGVTCDNFDGARQAARHLLKLGHRRILYIGGPRSLSSERDRLAGFNTTLQEAGLTLDMSLSLEADFDQATARGVVREFLGHGVPFTAVFASDDVMAFGAREALEEAGLPVPGSVSLVGFDDVPFAEAIGLTTVAQPAGEMGRNAFLLLLDVAAGRVDADRRIVLRPSMVLRTSCGVCARDTP